MVPSIYCYYQLTPFLCAVYAFPAIIYVMIAKPHDCFYCLSVRPECRISNFQFTREMQEGK